MIRQLKSKNEITRTNKIKLMYKGYIFKINNIYSLL